MANAQKSPLSKQQLDEFKKLMIDRIAEIWATTRADVRDESARQRDEPWAQDDSPRDEADEATFTQLSDLRHSLDERQAALAQAMEAALRRMRDGTYGLCRDCGSPIELDRLRLVPWTTLCIDDQEAFEQQMQERPPTL